MRNLLRFGVLWRLGVLICLLLAVMGVFWPQFFPSWRNRIPIDAKLALRAPEKVVLYSLEPVWPPDDKVERFYKYKLLGHAELNRSDAAAAISEFESAVSAGNPNIHAACFDPRHALRVTARNHIYDLLLCYECRGMHVLRDGKLIASLSAGGSPKILNGILTAANVPLAAAP